MRYAKVSVMGISPYSQGRFHAEEKLSKEAADAYEKRTWKEKGHYNPDGHLVIPALAFKNCMAEIAKYLSIQIPGKGKATYTKHFEAGVSVYDDSVIYLNGEPITRETIPACPMHVPSDGRRGGGSRVMRIFPTIAAGWTSTIEFTLFDDVITQDVFMHHLGQAGQLIGIGSFRVRNNGVRGRFMPQLIEWDDKYEIKVPS